MAVGPYDHPDKREFSSTGPKARFPHFQRRRFGRMPLPNPSIHEGAVTTTSPKFESCGGRCSAL
jgi:hypothetical protein